MDIRLDRPDGVQFIESYGAGRFQVAGVYYSGTILVTPEQTLSCPVETPVETIEDLSVEILMPLLDNCEVGVLLFGCGLKTCAVPSDVRMQARQRGFVSEPMNTGAACRTYNVLLSEKRPVSALLIAVE